MIRDHQCLRIQFQPQLIQVGVVVVFQQAQVDGAVGGLELHDHIDVGDEVVDRRWEWRVTTRLPPAGNARL